LLSCPQHLLLHAASTVDDSFIPSFFLSHDSLAGPHAGVQVCGRGQQRPHHQGRVCDLAARFDLLSELVDGEWCEPEQSSGFFCLSLLRPREM